jgi:hypothetical protein
MVDLDNIGEKTTSLRSENFPAFREKGREVSLENPFAASFSEVAPDEVAVFCRICPQIVTLIYVYNEEKFNYYRQMCEVLLVLPKKTSSTIASKTVVSSKKVYTEEQPWWTKL